MLALLVSQDVIFLLLDEPLNHLDLASQATFKSALSTFEGTILAIAHDRNFINRFAQVVRVFSAEGIQGTLTRAMVHKFMES